jgi:hypothetical protein
MKELYERWTNARKYFMMHAMKGTYGDIRDRMYNYESALIWNKIISDLRIQIILKQDEL